MLSKFTKKVKESSSSGKTDVATFNSRATVEQLKSNDDEFLVAEPLIR